MFNKDIDWQILFYRVKKFDPLGHNIQRFVPELQRVPEKFIHTHWEMPEELQHSCGCVLGKDYPRSIVDHHAAKD